MPRLAGLDSCREGFFCGRRLERERINLGPAVAATNILPSGSISRACRAPIIVACPSAGSRNSLAEIDAELKACTDRILTMIAGLTQ